METKTYLTKIGNILTFLPIIIFSSIVPLIVYQKVIELSDLTAANWTNFSYSLDVFSYYKMIAVIACAILALIMVIIKIVRKTIKFRFSVLTAAAVLYLLLTILSAIFSDYPSIVFWGAPERYEGIIVIFSYIFIFIYTITVIDSLTKIKYIILPLVASLILILTVSTLQFFGFDIFRVDFTMGLLKMRSTAEFPYFLKIEHNPNTAYSTMYNPNYLGVYLALIIPIILSFYSIAKSKSGKLAVIILIYLCFLSLIGSSTTGAYYSLIFSLLLMFILSFRYIKKNMAGMLIMIVAVFILLMITNVFTNNRLLNNIIKINTSAEVINMSQGNTAIYINDIVLMENSVFIDTTHEDFTLVNENKTISVFDGKGAEIPVFIYDQGEKAKFSGDIIIFEKPGYSDYYIMVNEDYDIIAFKAGFRQMVFYMTENGVKVPGINNSLNDIQDIERNDILYDHLSLFSGRGYIWSCTLPLLRNTVILGNGPDTFFLTFPQNDYIGKINMSGRFSVLVDKPHSFYLQIAHDSGWIALIILLFMFGWYLIETLLRLKKDRTGGLWRKYSIALFCGILGYLIASIVYDSAIFIAPVFWTLLAVGVSLNRISKNSTAALLNKKAS